MKTSQKIKEFDKKLQEILKSNIENIDKQYGEAIVKLQKLTFTSFTNETPYTGPTSNTIFFTYSNCYRYNSPTYMSVGNLRNAHLSYEDRGYIKGVATDLDGYLLLRSIKCIRPYDSIYLYKPKFNKSKHSVAYNSLVDSMINVVNNTVLAQIDVVNSNISLKIKELTGCQLLHYLRDI